MSLYRIKTFVMFSLVLACCVCCGKRIVVLRGGPAPQWVDRLPTRPGELCAVGYSGPTFYQQDCVKNASQNGRAHLSESISVTIRTITVDISDGTRGHFSKDVFVEGSESASESVLHGSEVEAQWLDMQGERGTPNGCFAMVCIDPNKPIEKLVQTLEEKKVPPKTVEQVRTNAQAAFEELEREEREREDKKIPTPGKPTTDSSTEEDSKTEQTSSSPLQTPSSPASPLSDTESDESEDLDRKINMDNSFRESPQEKTMPAIRTLTIPGDKQ